ncbi:hypothetical protein G3U99_19490 [Vibrio coralliilyticus OCN008]|uniref:hypothetical protein n=1 Tax=Vibrio coralliilyticus TaxID=190893 RepID=UPI0003914DBC|nr:hypothetical protein [Vibrio coralliilyticus]ERB65743.1 hypothetical protein N779_08610 [Vibrio coralliilyticus OCN008]QIJ86448.1 hypothetical protein G3U99_19490 [Vibrio coralliilyticus OCN008]
MQFKHWFIKLIAISISTLWSLIALAAPPFEAPPGLAVAAAAQEKHNDSLMQTSGVVGHGLSVDESGAGVIVVFTDTPTPKGIPKWLDGVTVKEVYTGRFYSFAPPTCGGPPSQRPPECFSDPEPDPDPVDPTARFDRPVPIGVSTGHPAITAGTIGARVTDGTNVFALSNNHVFANSNDTSIPENMLQPGPYDGGVENGDTFATLTDYEPILFGGAENTMDAAVALTSTGELGTSTPEGGYGIPNSQTVNATLNQSVKKYGRTTGFTQGIVAAINVTVDVCYEGSTTCTKLARFVGQISISDGSFSSGGDSGSLIVTSEGNNPVGLLFAGSSTRTIASPIDPVLARFNVTIDSEAPPPPPPSGDISLTTSGYKVKGLQKANLEWSGSAATDVDIYRDGSVVATVGNTGFYTDNINNKGGGSYNHKVCEKDTNVCSNTTTTNF